MTLAEYMKANNLDDETIASQIGDCSAHAVKKWKYAERIPRPEAIDRIVEVTSGQVTAADMIAAYQAASKAREGAAA